jgi:hypothetical protein
MIAQDVKQVCQKMGHSVVLIGGSAAPDDLRKALRLRSKSGKSKKGEDAQCSRDETTPETGGWGGWAQVLMDINKSS